MFNALATQRSILNTFALTDGFDLGWFGIVIALIILMIFIYGFTVFVVLSTFAIKNAKKNSATNKEALSVTRIDEGSYISGMSVDVFFVSIIVWAIANLAFITNWDGSTWATVLFWMCALVIPHRVIARLIIGKTVGETIIKSPKYINNARNLAFIGDVVVPLLLMVLVRSNLGM